MEELVGTVDKIIFAHESNGFCVFLLQLTKKESVTACGTIPALQAGQNICVKGTWAIHPTFGKQFQVQHSSTQLPTSTEGLKKYLGSGLIKGIGKAYAEKLVNHFKTEVLSIIDEQPHRLSEVPGIGQKRVEQIITAWKDQREIASIMVFLQEKGASPAFAAKIYKHYGNQSITIVSKNPYRLAQDVWGIGFKMADTIAQKLGFEKESLNRITAGILFAITTATSNGHLYIELENLKKTILTLLELESSESLQSLIKQALHELYNTQKIKLISKEEIHYVTMSQYYFTEKSVASKITQLLTEKSPFSFDIQKIYEKLRVETPGTISLNEAQQQGIISCLTHKMSIITGGPGTGKTTLIRTLLGILDEHRCHYKLAAPTGRAAKRMAESTKRFSVTLHRLLEFSPQTMGFIHNESNALKLDFLIVDEASMIDIFLAHGLLKAVPLQAHIIFIGDIDQLPSVGAGNFLNDIIASNKVPTTRLSYIFRQANNSLITANAHRINAGQFPLSKEPNCIQDYYFMKEDNTENLMQHIRMIIHSTLKKHHIDISNTMVLTPMNKGSAGTIAINHYLQSIINPGTHKDHVTRLGTMFKIGDRVMQIRNNYDKNVFNGDIGTIEAVNNEDQKMTVVFNEAPISYEFSEIDELVLAYAISIHKSQGSEFDAVIMPIFTQHFTLLQRNLIYTGITRAKKLCIIIGQTRALAMAINNNKNIKRITFLADYLTTDLSCR